MAIAEDSGRILPRNPNLIAYVTADPSSTPRGYGAGSLTATVDHRVVALVLKPLQVKTPELRLLINAEGAVALAQQLTAAVDKLAAGHA